MTTSVFIHEIKNSLNVIYGIAQLFEIGEVTAATDVSEYAKTLKKCVEQITSVCNDYRDYEHLNKDNIKYETANVKPILIDIMNEYALMAAKHNVEFKIDLKLARVHTDIPKLKSALCHIISNAIKYSNKSNTSIIEKSDITERIDAIRKTIERTRDKESNKQSGEHSSGPFGEQFGRLFGEQSRELYDIIDEQDNNQDDDDQEEKIQTEEYVEDPILDVPDVSGILINKEESLTKYVYVHCHTVSDGVEIIIRDDGIGMSDKELQQVGTPFYRARKNDADGTGLGLAIVKKTADLLGWQFKIEKNSDKGTKVTIKITHIMS